MPMLPFRSAALPVWARSCSVCWPLRGALFWGRCRCRCLSHHTASLSLTQHTTQLPTQTHNKLLNTTKPQVRARGRAPHRRGAAPCGAARPPPRAHAAGGRRRRRRRRWRRRRRLLPAAGRQAQARRGRCGALGSTADACPLLRPSICCSEGGWAPAAKRRFPGLPAPAPLTHLPPPSPSLPPTYFMNNNTNRGRGAAPQAHCVHVARGRATDDAVGGAADRRRFGGEGGGCHCWRTPLCFGKRGGGVSCCWRAPAFSKLSDLSDRAPAVASSAVRRHGSVLT